MFESIRENTCKVFTSPLMLFFVGWSVIVFLSPYGNERLVPTKIPRTLSYVGPVEEVSLAAGELAGETLSNLAIWGTKREGPSWGQIHPVLLSPSGWKKGHCSGAALFNLMQLVEHSESLACSKKECWSLLSLEVQGFLHGSVVKNLPAMQETADVGLILDWEDPLEKDMATHTIVLLVKSNGQRSLVVYCPWGCKELDTTDHVRVRAHTHTHLYILRYRT